MIYDYKYKDGDKEEFQSEEMRLEEHNGRPCHRIFTTGFRLNGVGWPGEEAKGAYARVALKGDNSLTVLE